MSNDDQVKVFGIIMASSLVLAGAVAALGHRFLGSGGSQAEATVFNALMYFSAALLLALLAWAPKLALGLEGRLPGGSGKLIAMASSEGIALLGIVAAGFAGQSTWAVALSVAGILAIARVSSSEVR